MNIRFDVQMNIPEEADLDVVSNNLADDGYSDGRKSFAYEMMQRGLEDHFKSAVIKAVQKHFDDIHGHEMVPCPSGNGSTNLASLKTREVAKDVSCRLSFDFETPITLEETK